MRPRSSRCVLAGQSLACGRVALCSKMGEMGGSRLTWRNPGTETRNHTWFPSCILHVNHKCAEEPFPHPHFLPGTWRGCCSPPPSSLPPPPPAASLSSQAAKGTGACAVTWPGLRSRRDRGLACACVTGHPKLKVIRKGGGGPFLPSSQVSGPENEASLVSLFSEEPNSRAPETGPEQPSRLEPMEPESFMKLVPFLTANHVCALWLVGGVTSLGCAANRTWQGFLLRNSYGSVRGEAAS